MTSPRRPTIALVAVHGAGDHRPGDAARVVADLLLRLRGDRGSRYASFVERPLRIPVKPACVNPRSAPNVPPALRHSIFAEQHPFLRTQLQYGGAAARDREEDSPDHQLMRAQLAEYRSAGEPYETLRLEGERLTALTEGGAAEVEAHVHVYEMRWSDLGRLGPRRLRVLANLYQLFFHVAHLGRTALDHARLEHAASPLWRAYGAAHGWAARLLTMFVPAVTAVLLGLIAGAGVLGIPAGVKPYVAAGCTALMAGALVAGVAYRSRVGRAIGLWLPIPAALALAAFGVTPRVRDPVLDAVQRFISNDLFDDRVLIGTWVLTAGVLIYQTFRAYERLRPGALAVGLATSALAAAPSLPAFARCRMFRPSA
jgi:hypothetical protein